MDTTPLISLPGPSTIIAIAILWGVGVGIGLRVVAGLQWALARIAVDRSERLNWRREGKCWRHLPCRTLYAPRQGGFKPSTVGHTRSAARVVPVRRGRPSRCLVCYDSVAQVGGGSTHGVIPFPSKPHPDGA